MKPGSTMTAESRAKLAGNTKLWQAGGAKVEAPEPQPFRPLKTERHFRQDDMDAFHAIQSRYK